MSSSSTLVLTAKARPAVSAEPIFACVRNGALIFSRTGNFKPQLLFLSGSGAKCRSIPQNSTRPVEIESPRILLAEDDFLTRMLVSDCLREDGFNVLEASNGDEAVDILQSGLSVDLIFTDVHMPGRTDGLQLLSFAQSRWPQLPVLLTSGHLDPAAAYEGGAAAFLPKPCNPDAVVAAVKMALEPAE